MATIEIPNGKFILTEEYQALCDLTDAHCLAANDILAGVLEEVDNKVTKLDLSGKHISRLNFLSVLTSLVELDLSSNHINDLSALSDLPLTTLNLHSNHVDDISALADITTLTNLDLSSNQIINVTPLASLTSLTTLDLSDNNISDISPIAGLNISNLDTSNNRF